MHYFATLFDINYLSRGLALLYSLNKEAKKPFLLYILCLDTEVSTYFEKKNLPNVKIIKLHDIEQRYPILKECKLNRKDFEYYFTLSPYLPLYILETFKEVEQITTMDADLFFFDDPAKIIDHYIDYSILITPHSFSDNIKHFDINGKYNVSFQSFKNDAQGLKCLKDWANKCAEWCYDYYDNDRYADQKYLDTWPHEYDKIASIELAGAGIAPWNLNKCNITYINNKPYINNAPLIYFHFHGLRKINNYFYSHCLNTYYVENKKQPIKIYQRYIKHLNQASDNINRINIKKEKKSHVCEQRNPIGFMTC